MQRYLLSPWLWPVLSGLCIGTSYIPFPPWAALFGFVPLWLFWLRQDRLKPVILGGLLTSFTFTLIGFNWVAHTLHEFAQIPWLFAVLGLLLYALLTNLYLPCAGLVWFYSKKLGRVTPTLSLVLMALLTILAEYFSYTLFDWNLGYTWYGAGLPIYQWAEFIGFTGLSAVTLLGNLGLALAWLSRNRVLGKALVGIVVISFGLLNGGGLWLASRLPEPDALFRPLLVQANIGSSQKLAAELGHPASDDIIARHMALTEKALSHYEKNTVDAVIWPETAFPAFLGAEFNHSDKAQLLSQFVKTQQLPLITGAFGVDMAVELMTNGLFVLGADGQLSSKHYNKTQLLALGEFIPGETYFPILRQWLPATGHFARGQGPSTLLTVNDVQFGAQICYESLFPAFSKALADLGAQVIINVTNDSWYGTWQEPYQHMYMTLARSVEFRRPVIRVTNTGITTVALASGEILQQSPLHQEWSGVYQVAYRKQPSPTFYQQHFLLMPVLCFIGVVLILLTMVTKKIRCGG